MKSFFSRQTTSNKNNILLCVCGGGGQANKTTYQVLCQHVGFDLREVQGDVWDQSK